jgi:hypothetical protein
LVSFCHTLAKFEAKVDANSLLLRVHRHKHDVIKSCRSKECVHSAWSHVAHCFTKDKCSATRRH